MVSSIKKVAKQCFPKLFKKLKGIHKQWQFRRFKGGCEYRAKKALVAQYGLQIISGPFKGLKYGHTSVCSAYMAKLIGSYEEELHGAIEDAIQKQPSVVIDVGCAEGYYAVGMAIRVPTATVYAFDIDLEAQEECLSLAKRNDVSDRVRMGGLCDHDVLADLTKNGALIICDCEGCEMELLDPNAVPTLAHCDIIVELHEYFAPGVTQVLQDRFAATHSFQLIDMTPRDISHYPCLSYVLPKDRDWTVVENRGHMQWGYLTALN